MRYQANAAIDNAVVTSDTPTSQCTLVSQLWISAISRCEQSGTMVTSPPRSITPSDHSAAAEEVA
jgi:hypothetical protein